MSVLNKIGDARYVPLEKTTSGNGIMALIGLQALREVALQKAIKYRWDPVLGKTHDEYLDFLNGILKEMDYEY